MRAVVTIGEEALKRIDEVKATANGAIKDHLNTCSDIYVSANGHASEAVKSLEEAKTDAAIVQISAAMRVQRSCDDGFKMDNLKNPVAELHPKWVKQANVALTICTLANPTGAAVPLA
ncbi:hypothetical protein M5689_023163 [Euphorbia peplus]|nr:hypothetical protein M5689_023163 [Euphorbia peplus]